MAKTEPTTKAMKTPEPKATEPKRKGRPPTPLPDYDGPTFGLEDGKVQQIPIGDLNIDDTTFQFRVDLRAEALVDSVRNHGIQVPLVARKLAKREGQYQLVCGFRRATAAKQAGLATVPVVVRELDDKQAQILSYAENEQRKTFSDLDRAQAVSKLRQAKHTTTQIAGFLRLGARQIQRLEGLLTYPDVLKRAVGDEGSGVTTTHALVLMQAFKKYPKLDLSEWVKRVRKEQLSLAALQKAIKAETGKRRGPRKFVRRRGDIVSFNFKALQKADPEVRKAAVSELEGILKKLKS